MACPAPASFDDCKPKCVCRYSECADIAYDCSDPCGNGDPSTFDAATCSCPSTFILTPAVYINATELFCDNGLQWDGWFKYPPQTEAQHERPTMVELGNWAARDCSEGINTRIGLSIILNFSDNTQRRFFGGTSFTQNHNQSKVLNAWDWGDAYSDSFYQLSITPIEY